MTARTYSVRLTSRFLDHLSGSGAWQAVQHGSDLAAAGVADDDAALFARILAARRRADRSITVRVTADEADALHLHAEVMAAGAADNLPDPDALADLNSGRAAMRALSTILQADLATTTTTTESEA